MTTRSIDLKRFTYKWKQGGGLRIELTEIFIVKNHRFRKYQYNFALHHKKT